MMRDMYSLRFEVTKLCNCMEAITLLHDAAGKCGDLGIHDNPIRDAIKVQEAKLAEYCMAQKERLADIIRTTGVQVSSNGVPDLMGGNISDKIYDCHGEYFRITTDADGCVEEIISVVDAENDKAYNDYVRDCARIVNKALEAQCYDQMYR